MRDIITSKPPHIQRLLKLAKHLESGKLGHKKFDFSTMNGTPFFNDVYDMQDEKYEPYKCGTNGCAIGECPILFKSAWKFDSEGAPNLRGEDSNGLYSDESARIFFSLTSDECDHLFMPGMQDTDTYGGRYLGDRATKKQVAKNIRIFVTKYKTNHWR